LLLSSGQPSPVLCLSFHFLEYPFHPPSNFLSTCLDSSIAVVRPLMPSCDGLLLGAGFSHGVLFLWQWAHHRASFQISFVILWAQVLEVVDYSFVNFTFSLMPWTSDCRWCAVPGLVTFLYPASLSDFFSSGPIALMFLLVSGRHFRLYSSLVPTPFSDFGRASSTCLRPQGSYVLPCGLLNSCL